MSPLVRFLAGYGVAALGFMFLNHGAHKQKRAFWFVGCLWVIMGAVLIVHAFLRK